MMSLKEGKDTGSEMHADLAFPLWELLTSPGVPEEIELNQKKAAGGKESEPPEEPQLVLKLCKHRVRL